MNIEINSEEELYQKLKNVLSIKTRDLKTKTNVVFKEKDIWEYLREYKWKNTEGLSLSMMVQDILYIKFQDILKYITEKEIYRR